MRDVFPMRWVHITSIWDWSDMRLRGRFKFRGWTKVFLYIRHMPYVPWSKQCILGRSSIPHRKSWCNSLLKDRWLSPNPNVVSNETFWPWQKKKRCCSVMAILMREQKTLTFQANLSIMTLPVAYLSWVSERLRIFLTVESTVLARNTSYKMLRISHTTIYEIIYGKNLGKDYPIYYGK